MSHAGLAERVHTFRATYGPGWFLNDGFDANYDNAPFGYGINGDMVVVGDWNDDDDDTVAVVRVNSSNQLAWYLRNDNSPGGADSSFAYGSSTDIPVVGDWDGDGQDTVGVVRRTASGLRWLLRNFNSGGSASYDFYYGSTTDTPVAGDWINRSPPPCSPVDQLIGNCQPAPPEIDSIGAVRVDAGQLKWLLRNTNTAGTPDAQFNYGSSTDRPLPGDWNDDGVDSVGVVRENTSAEFDWLLRNSNSAGSPDVAQFQFGGPPDVAVRGNWGRVFLSAADTPGFVRGST